MTNPSARTFVLAALTLGICFAVGPMVLARPQVVCTSTQVSQGVSTESNCSIGPLSSRRARMVVSDFAATSGDAQAAAIGRTVAEVLWNDLDFEREFEMIPRDASIDAAAPDVVLRGTVDVRSGVATVEVRLVPAAGTQEPLFARRYTGSTANPRAFAHTISDQIHEQALLYVTR